jgi:DNA-binding CsgD family transcriptional regulator/catechol 2,3-dioxygenase-like lactoylglutathione lyase family enzyme
MAHHGKRGRPPHTDVLTPTEWRVVEAVRHGMTSREIASRRGISVDAVKYHVSNALQKLGLSNRKELRQWNGVARTTALHAKGPHIIEQTTIGAIGQIARRVKDVAAAREWYRDVLGLAHLYSFGDLAFFDCDGVRLLLSKDDKANQIDSIIYFRVKDIRSAHADLTSRGVEFINAPHMIHRHDDGTEEWMAFFKDNEERPLAIMAQVKADS